MRVDINQRRIRWAFRGGLSQTLERALFKGADAIGFCVGEFRLHGVPKIKSAWQLVRSVGGASPRKEPSFVTVTKHTEQESPLGFSQADTSEFSDSGKKYTYAWAVGRIAELEQTGISDPVTYFNNEMTDWWLAPDGMMDEEADFNGIAHAIEERWHL